MHGSGKSLQSGLHFATTCAQSRARSFDCGGVRKDIYDLPQCFKPVLRSLALRATVMLQVIGRMETFPMLGPRCFALQPSTSRAHAALRAHAPECELMLPAPECEKTASLRESQHQLSNIFSHAVEEQCCKA